MPHGQDARSWLTELLMEVVERPQHALAVRPRRRRVLVSSTVLTCRWIRGARRKIPHVQHGVVKPAAPARRSLCLAKGALIRQEQGAAIRPDHRATNPTGALPCRTITPRTYLNLGLTLA